MIGTARRKLAQYLNHFDPRDDRLPRWGWRGHRSGKDCMCELRAETIWELHIDPYGNIQTNCGMILGRLSETTPAVLPLPRMDVRSPGDPTEGGIPAFRRSRFQTGSRQRRGRAGVRGTGRSPRVARHGAGTSRGPYMRPRCPPPILPLPRMDVRSPGDPTEGGRGLG